MTTIYDAIIIGSSPNALTLAAYLSKAKERVLVIEPSKYLGGIASTTSFAEGFQADLGLMSGQLNSKIINELSLSDYGLEVIERNSITSLLANQKSFTLSSDPKEAVNVIQSFAPRDAERYQKFLELLNLAKELLESAYLITPLQAHNPSVVEREQLATLLGQLHAYGRREMPEVIRLLVMSSRDLLDEWFENTELKGLLASLSVRALTQGTFASGTTFNLLHHLAIGDGYFRTTAKGGIGAICQALAKAAKSFGAEILTDTKVSSIDINDSTATGVKLENGEIIKATKVISDYDARYSFTKLVSPIDLEPEFNREVKHIRYKGSVARVNLALSDLPSFTGLNQEALKGTLVISPSVAYIEKAFDRAKYGQMSSQPFIEACIPSLSDPTLAPSGKHVMSIWLQYVPYKGNISQEQVENLAITKLSEFAPNLKSLVLQSQVLTPQDFEAEFNLSEGHLYGGEMMLSQAFFLRPLAGFAQYQTPIEKLYLCGAATHPGGGISGLAGRNLANKLSFN
ncbi:MAG: NAD(P)/FAD-dependent oxidoreductase [Acidobacteria bacterium]|nr:NAD(P)/FAD-dependent oxidoreductase [Acidobacteriota bacterium]